MVLFFIEPQSGLSGKRSQRSGPVCLMQAGLPAAKSGTWSGYPGLWVQSGLEYFQGWVIHSLFVPAPHHPLSKKFPFDS